MNVSFTLLFSYISVALYDPILVLTSSSEPQVSIRGPITPWAQDVQYEAGIGGPGISCQITPLAFLPWSGKCN